MATQRQFGQLQKIQCQSGLMAPGVPTNIKIKVFKELSY